MTTSLADVVSQPPSGRPRAVLIDSHDYAQRVLLHGKPWPWHDATASSNICAQMQAMLDADVVLLSLDRYYIHEIEVNAALRQAMRAKARTGYALRTLLGDEPTSGRARALATVFSQAQRRPVVLHILSPIRWLAATHDLSVTTSTGQLTNDHAENASLYVADWLRGFAGLPLAGVLLDDRDRGDGNAEPVPLDTYSPIANVARHYGWTLGLRAEDEVELSGSTSGPVVPQGFWLSDDPAPEGPFLFTEIPPDTVPETVLRRVGTLR